MGDRARTTGMLLRLKGESRKLIKARKGELYCRILC